MTQLSMSLRKVQELLPYARNSRTHSGAQVAEIAASIDEFGLVGGIVVRDGVIAKGHGTLAAIRKLYEAGKLVYPAPGRSAGAKPYPEDTVPTIDTTGWSDAQFRAYVIADNKLAEHAGWDTEALAVEFAELRDDGFDMSLTGFTDKEIDELLGEVTPLGDLPDLPDGDKDEFEQMTFTLHEDQARTVREALDAAAAMGAFDGSENKNKNGNALARVCEMFLGRHG